MKRILTFALILTMVFSTSACGSSQAQGEKAPSAWADAVRIDLSDSSITVDGEFASTDPAHPVYTANDIVYYEDGKDFTYGEGTDTDAHSAKDAAAPTVVHITQPGTYALRRPQRRGNTGAQRRRHHLHRSARCYFL